MKVSVAIFVFIACIALSSPSFAAASQKDMQIAGRVLGFVSTPITGDVKFGIVYDAANAASNKEEQDLVALLGSGLKVGNVNFIPVPVPIDKLDSTASDVLFLTGGLGADGAKVGAAAKAKKEICITADIAATQAGNCTLSIQSEPKVQITVNKAAADASGVSFSAAFKMMITEI